MIKVHPIKISKLPMKKRSPASGAADVNLLPRNEPIAPVKISRKTGRRLTLFFLRNINPAIPPIIPSIRRLVPIASWTEWFNKTVKQVIMIAAVVPEPIPTNNPLQKPEAIRRIIVK